MRADSSALNSHFPCVVDFCALRLYYHVSAVKDETRFLTRRQVTCADRGTKNAGSGREIQFALPSRCMTLSIRALTVQTHTYHRAVLLDRRGCACAPSAPFFCRKLINRWKVCATHVICKFCRISASSTRHKFWCSASMLKILCVRPTYGNHWTDRPCWRSVLSRRSANTNAVPRTRAWTHHRNFAEIGKSSTCREYSSFDGCVSPLRMVHYRGCCHCETFLLSLRPK